MEGYLLRAQHYRTLSMQMLQRAELERDEKRRKELAELATQYSQLADKLIQKQAGHEPDSD